MIPVSNAWASLQNETLLPEMFVEITYTVTEPGLQEDAVVAGGNAEAYSNMGEITGEHNVASEKYTMLDYGMWGLDGQFGFSDGSPKKQGYVNKNRSSSDGSVSATITINFSERHTELIPGITITWSETFNCWATDFIVRSYNSQGMILEKKITGNNSVVSKVMVDLVDYSQITIEVLKWSHPYCRPRCVDIRMGISDVYTKEDLLSYEHSQSADMLSATLPASGIAFSLRNDDGRWNPGDPSDVEKYLIEEQELKVRYGMNVNGVTEWIDGGVFWLSEWNTPSNGLGANFTAKDAFSLMDKPYTGSLSGSLYSIATDAIVEADLPTSVGYFIDTRLNDLVVNVSGDTNNYTVAAVLQMVAHAANCVIYQDRAGNIHIEPRSNTYSGYMISEDISYSHPEYTINKPLQSISVGYGSDGGRAIVAVNTKGEVQTIDNPFIMTREDAVRVANNARDVLSDRKVLSGEFRADLRLDALDNIIVISKYSSNIICVTDIKYSTTGGTFRGQYTGRMISVNLLQNSYYSNELFVGEV